MWMYSKGADSSDIYGIEEVLSLACFMPIGDHKQEIDGIAFLAVQKAADSPRVISFSAPFFIIADQVTIGNQVGSS